MRHNATISPMISPAARPALSKKLPSSLDPFVLAAGDVEDSVGVMTIVVTPPIVVVVASEVEADFLVVEVTRVVSWELVVVLDFVLVDV
jgi:hypothetical protein